MRLWWQGNGPESKWRPLRGKIYQLYKRGKTHREIAKKLKLSETTVRECLQECGVKGRTLREVWDIKLGRRARRSRTLRLLKGRGDAQSVEGSH